MNDILDSLEWSAPQPERGRWVSVAFPSPEFWGIWRSDKNSVKEAGVRVRPASGGWECWKEVNQPVRSDVANNVAEQPVESPAEPSGRAAALVPDFQAPALDSSRAWSDEQNAIFGWFRSGSGNLQVRARAGTGKTTTIKVAFSQAPEAEMLYAVFNKKNQVEAQGSITDPRVEIKTLHAVGFKLIRMMWRSAKPDERVEFERAQQAAGPGAPDEVVSTIKRLVGFAKNCYVNPSFQNILDLADKHNIECDDFASQGWNAAAIGHAAIRVLELSRVRDPQGRISFNDMVWLPVAQGWVRPLFDLVVVDEAQDMNLPQLLMARGLVRAGGRSCVVGDDRQAIYGFRGAAQDGMAMMARELNAQVLPLTITYRCPKSVVAKAAELVPDYRAADAAPEGVICNASMNGLLDSLVVGDAVLSRANAPLMPLCLKLLKRNISARIEGRDIGQALAAIVRKLNAKSVPSFIARIDAWGKRQMARLVKNENYEAKCELINDQVDTLIAVAEGAANVKEIEERLLSLFQDSDGNQKPAVVLSSVHKAKGLEWERVHLIMKTFKAAKNPSSAVSEEANIYYVAMTRAKRELVLVEE